MKRMMCRSTLLCKEGGLGIVTWVEQGSKRTKTLQTEDNREEKLAASGGENSEKEIGDDSDQKTSKENDYEWKEEKKSSNFFHGR